jgi:sugar lactone lactonase YvrE
LALAATIAALHRIAGYPTVSKASHEQAMSGYCCCFFAEEKVRININSLKMGLAVAALGSLAALNAAPVGQAVPSLTEVFTDPDFQLTGVTVSKSGRMFVNYPRWSDHYVNAVVEVQKDHSVKPYPDEYWNRWGGLAVDAGKQFVCVQSVVADDHDVLWVVDAAAPLMGPAVQGGAKLVAVDLRSNKVTKIYAFGPEVIKPNSYLNDVRVDNGTHTAYMTDSGEGGIVVVDLASGKARRALDGSPSVKAEEGATLTIDGKQLLGADGKPPKINSDGIALSPKGDYLYYQALTASTLYRVKTASLRGSDGDAAAAAAEKVADTFPVDGMWMDKQGNLYLSELQQNGVFRRSAEGKMEKVVTDQRLQWPDTFTEGPDGSIYITASHINESPRFNKGTDARTSPYGVFKIRP